MAMHGIAGRASLASGSVDMGPVLQQLVRSSTQPGKQGSTVYTASLAPNPKAKDPVQPGCKPASGTKRSASEASDTQQPHSSMSRTDVNGLVGAHDIHRLHLLSLM
ncbi:hypothetical protein QJQ45_001935 [Haematococcus lacustris]|nr:hypothetical protein QJQ45_001935 [Haematococcus lacustris]